MRSNPKHGFTQSMSLRPSLYEGLFNLNDVSLLAFGSLDTVRKKNVHIKGSETLRILNAVLFNNG